MTATREVFKSYLSKYRHNILHHPNVDGHPAPATPYIFFPFSQEDLVSAADKDKTGVFTKRRPYYVSEGFYYSRPERDIHGKSVHGGIDIAVPENTLVVAPFDAYVMSSYLSVPITNPDGKTREYQGKPLFWGFGYFVSLYNPEADRYVILAHLSDINESIPFSKPSHNRASDSWYPNNYMVPIVDMPTHPSFVKVRRGDPIGHAGFSGLRWGYEEHRERANRPVRVNVNNKSFDERHVHIEEFRRNQKTGAKGLTRDPYDIYMRWRGNYPTPTRVGPMGPEPLWILDGDGLPMFAR